MLAHSLLYSKSTEGAAKLNIPIRRKNRYQQYYMSTQHTYCGRVWNLTQALMYNLAIRNCTSPPPNPEIENFQMKIHDLAGDRTPDPLNQRQTCYHLSQRGGCSTKT